MASRWRQFAPGSSSPALAALAAASAFSWVYLTRPQAMDMGTGPDAMGMMMAAGPVAWTTGHAAKVLAMWAAMATAMMLPTAAPALLRMAQAAGRPGRRVLAFAGGYLALWMAVAVAATALQWMLERAGLLVDGMVRTPVAASLVIAAVGVWQVLPLKRACLALCAALGAPSKAPDGWAAAESGLRYGLPCLGASGPLMLLPVAAGLTSAPWLGLLTVWLVLERVSSRSGLVAALGGFGLVAYAIARLAWAR